MKNYENMNYKSEPRFFYTLATKTTQLDGFTGGVGSGVPMTNKALRFWQAYPNRFLSISVICFLPETGG